MIILSSLMSILCTKREGMTKGLSQMKSDESCYQYETNKSIYTYDFCL